MQDQPRNTVAQLPITRIGPHFLVSRTQWVPGEHPEPHRRDEREGYFETFYRCRRCGTERVNLDDFPTHCSGESL